MLGRSRRAHDQREELGDADVVTYRARPLSASQELTQGPHRLLTGSRPRDPGVQFRSVRVHETVDPEVIVTEFEVHGVAAGSPYQFANLQVMTVRNGEIASLRDYWNPFDRRELAALTDPDAGRSR